MIPEMPRVLLISPQPFFQWRGSPLRVRFNAQALAELGYDVDLLVMPVGDDLALPGKLQAIADYLDAHPGCAVCYHEAEVFESETGKVTAEIARAHAESEFEKYRSVQDRLFESDFDRMMKQIEAVNQAGEPKALAADKKRHGGDGKGKP